jgi:spore germination protein YaaH
MAERKPIFYDHRRRRWRYTRRLLEISGALFALVVVIFLFDVARKPDLPGLLLPDSRPLYHALHLHSRTKPVQSPRAGRHRRIEALGKVPSQYDPLRAAFYVSWDSNSLAALQKHYHDIDLLIPEALHAVSPDGRLDLDQDPKLAAWEQSAHLDLPEMSLVNNYDGTNWQVAPMAQMLAKASSRTKLANALANFASTHHQVGIVVDFEEIPEKSQGDFKLFAQVLGQTLHGVHQKLMIALPAADWSYDYAYLSAQADAIILMNYDQHWATSKPGPIVAQDWYQRNLQNILKIVPPQKIVMGIANYAYDWPAATADDHHPVAEASSFQWAVNRAIESGSEINFDPDTLNLQFSYEDGDVTHNVWMLDAVTAYNELRAAERAGVQGTALWRLGSEDPSLWDIWDTTHPDDATRAKLEVVPPGYDLILEGGGDIWRITATPTPGKRSFDYDPATDTFTDDNFEKYPLAYRIGS